MSTTSDRVELAEPERVYDAQPKSHQAMGKSPRFPILWCETLEKTLLTVRKQMPSSRIPRRQTTSTCAEAMMAIAVPAASASSFPARFPSTAASSHARAKRGLSYHILR
ncbi:hypothetical protein H0G86_004096 [Trichoderma simmonsii]|uniref:Uncharacterized protein n=1 Tax=Trichoderma simmonsii TaxID=1491479 RepID=A0A8G0L6X4_9HYPO|nr:hypothetical protein H0G86_004096 [Trichoderma simmonsii]